MTFLKVNTPGGVAYLRTASIEALFICNDGTASIIMKSKEEYAVTLPIQAAPADFSDIFGINE